MLPVSAPKIERLKVTATEALPAGYKFDESTNEGTQQILDTMFLRSLGIKEEDPRFESALYLVYLRLVSFFCQHSNIFKK